MNASLLRLDKVSKTFESRKPVEALRGVSLRVEAGEFVSIVGPSGCGKSTLFNLIAGLDAATGGRIETAGESSAVKRLGLTAYMFQKDLLFPWRNALDNAALGLEVSGHLSLTEARQRAALWFERFGLAGFEASAPAELSGGMRQRVALLRTLLLHRPLLLLDEPFASLDALTRRELQDWLHETWRNGSEAALLVTHDVREAVALSHRIYVMSRRPGRIIAEIEGPTNPEARKDPTLLAGLESAVLEALYSEAAGVA